MRQPGQFDRVPADPDPLDRARQGDVGQHDRPQQHADGVHRGMWQMLAKERDRLRLEEQDGAAQHHPAECEGQAAERHRLADLERGQSPVRIQPVSHRGARHRREAEIMRQRIGTERGEGDPAVGHLVAGVDGPQPVVKGQDEVRKNCPGEGKHQRRRRDRLQRRSDVLQPQMAELALHDVDRADQQQHAEHRGQMAQPALRAVADPAVHQSGRIRRRLGSERVFGGEGRPDQGDGFRNAIESHETAEARPFLLAQQHLVKTAEPGAQFRERVALADLEHDVLDRLRRGRPGWRPAMRQDPPAPHARWRRAAGSAFRGGRSPGSRRWRGRPGGPAVAGFPALRPARIVR